MLLWKNVITSSTAQGGGGSFKNRKPIGEVGCCETADGRADPLMDRSHWRIDRWLMSPLSLSFSLFLWLSTYLPTDLSILSLSHLISSNLSIYLLIYLSTYLLIYLSTYLPICSNCWNACVKAASRGKHSNCWNAGKSNFKREAF